MITIQHARATFKVKPENEQDTRDLLAIIDKSKGKRGAKLKRPKAIRRVYNSGLRSYPVFYSGLSTVEYINAYVALNKYLFVGGYADDKILSYTYANRRAPELDPTTPEVVEEKNN
jgi:hypothetical protein